MQKVNIFSVTKNERFVSSRGTKNAQYRVKWRVDGNDKTRAFRNKLLAEDFQRKLHQAKNNGSPFDPLTGEPTNWQNRIRTFLEVAIEYIELKKGSVAPASLRSSVEALTYSVIHLSKSKGATPHQYKHLTAATRELLLPSSQSLSEEVRTALGWLKKSSMRIADIDLRTATALLKSLNTYTDGTTVVSPNTLRRRRQAVSAAFNLAVRLEYVKKNPVAMAEFKSPAIEEAIDTDGLPSPKECKSIVEALSLRGAIGNRLGIFVSCIWLGGLRPSEVLALKKSDLILRANGENEIRVSRGAVQVGKAWTPTGESQSIRPPKWRAVGHVRRVPIPNELAKKLEAYTSKMSADQLLFAAERKEGSLNLTVFEKGWMKVRPGTTTLYDLRHVNASILIYAGLNIIEVASRLGHSVSVCSRIYLHAFKAFEAKSNQQVEDFLEANQ
jgi:integrase